jgi:hypothetical protein
VITESSKEAQLRAISVNELTNKRSDQYKFRALILVDAATL